MGAILTRRRLTILTGVLYVMVMTMVAVYSYLSRTYEFDPTWLFTLAAAAGITAVISWRDIEISRRDYWLPTLLMIAMFISYPSTSRDPFHYLFVGEIVRLLHLSPYNQAPSALPVDQYSIIFKDTYWYHLPSPWGPLWQAVMASINWLSRNDLRGGMLLLKVLNGFSLILCARYVSAITRRPWLAFGLLINPLMLINTLHTPHTDIVLAALILAAYYHVPPLQRGGLLAVAALIKPHMLILAPFFERRWQKAWKLGVATAACTAAVVVALKPILNIDLYRMLEAAVRASSAGSPLYSLLLARLFPGMARNSVITASYCVFAVASAAAYLAFIRGKISSLQALISGALLVQLLLQGLLYPWHLMIALALLSLSETVVAAEAALFISLFAFRAPVNVLKFLLAGGAVASVHYIVHRIPAPAQILISWNGESRQP